MTVRLDKIPPARLATALEKHGFKLRVEDPSFVRTTRVLPVLHFRTSVPADLVLAGPGLEDAFLQRAVVYDLGGVAVPVASAEDVIVMKVLAGRDKDMDDIAAILAAQGAELDENQILTTLTMVEDALGQSDLVPTWKHLSAEIAQAHAGTKAHQSEEVCFPARGHEVRPQQAMTRESTGQCSCNHSFMSISSILRRRRRSSGSSPS